jgi:hypothetical protein
MALDSFRNRFRWVASDDKKMRAAPVHAGGFFVSPRRLERIAPAATNARVGS